MRYYLDTEYNGWGGALLSLALVPEDGEEFYAILTCDEPLEPWVERHVLPFLNHVPDALQGPPLARGEAAEFLASYLSPDPAPEIVADWPEDIAQLNALLLIGPGLMVPTPALTFRLVPLPNYSVAENSAVPHNALHDARALRDHIRMIEG